jgi:hypothetical protein
VPPDVLASAQPDVRQAGTAAASADAAPAGARPSRRVAPARWAAYEQVEMEAVAALLACSASWDAAAADTQDAAARVPRLSAQPVLLNAVRASASASAV